MGNGFFPGGGFWGTGPVVVVRPAPSPGEAEAGRARVVPGRGYTRDDASSGGARTADRPVDERLRRGFGGRVVPGRLVGRRELVVGGRAHGQAAPVSARVAAPAVAPAGGRPDGRAGRDRS
jgi:hypothetical protein